MSTSSRYPRFSPPRPWLAAAGWSLLAACGGSAGDHGGGDGPATAGPAFPEPVAVGRGPSDADDAGPDLPEAPTALPTTPSVQPRCVTSPELTGDVLAATQRDIDGLAGCEVIHGSLEIWFAEPLDLSPLASLRVVDGRLFIAPEASADTDPVAPLRLRSLRGLEALEAVGDLLVSRVDGGLAPLSRLRGDVASLILADIPGLVDLQALANVRVTRLLSVESMPDMVSLAGAHAGPELEDLSMSYMPKLESLEGIEGLTSVRYLMVYEAAAMNHLGLPESMTSLSSAHLTGALGLTTLSELSRFTTLADLRVHDSPLLTDLGGGGALSGSLETLELSSCPALSAIEPVGGLSGVVQVSVTDCDGVIELDGLASSPLLERLSISDNDSLTRLPAFDLAGSTMRAVRIGNNAALVDGPSFPNLTTLYEFDSLNFQHAELQIDGNPLLRGIGNFPLLQSASMVTISRNPALEAVSLPRLQTLSWLRVTDNASLLELQLDLRNDLRQVELDENPVLANVTLGAPAQPLDLLTLRGNPALAADVRALLLDLTHEETELTLD